MILKKNLLIPLFKIQPWVIFLYLFSVVKQLYNYGIMYYLYSLKFSQSNVIFSDLLTLFPNTRIYE